MKFEISIHKIVKNHPQIFRRDPCTPARTWGENVRTRVSSRQKARGTFRSHVRVCMHGSLRKIIWYFFTISWMKVLNFIKIGAFVVEIFAKQYWRLFNPSFSLYFVYFQDLSIKVLPFCKNYTKLIGAFENYISKCPEISEKKNTHFS